MTVLDLITLAFDDIGVTGDGQALSGYQTQKGLTVLNSMLDAWAAQRLLAWTITRSVYNFTAGKYQYTIGPNAPVDCLQARPMTIQNWGVLLTASATNPPLELSSADGQVAMMDADQWSAWSLKGLSSTWPTALYYDYGNVNGNATLSFNFTPTQAGNQFAIYWPQTVSQFSNTQLTSQIYLPPDYQEAMEGGLATRLAPKFGRSVPPEIAAMAQNAFRNIKSRNSYAPDLATPFDRMRGYYNVYSDSRN